MKKRILRYAAWIGCAMLLNTGCSTIKLTGLEQDVIQETLDNAKQTETYCAALRTLEAEQTNAEEFTPLAAQLTELQRLIPSSLTAYQGNIPQRVRLKKEEKERIVKDAYPLSQKTAEHSEKLNNTVATEVLKQVASNLEIIWSVNNETIEAYRRSATYVTAHNGFLEARKRYPDVAVPPTMQFSEFLLTLNEQTGEFAFSSLNSAVPDAKAAADAIEKSDKICEKILFHYLTRTGETSVSLMSPEKASQIVATAEEQPSDNYERRILAALDETFGLTGELVPQAENTLVVHYPLGRYSLSMLEQSERDALERFVNDFAALVAQKETQASPLVIAIKTVGYTDEIGLKEESPFVKELIKRFEDAGETFPTEAVERRKALNASFSRLRALIINEHLKQLLQKRLQNGRQAQMISEILGKGEEMPSLVAAPIADEDRRVCEVTLSIQYRTSNQ